MTADLIRRPYRPKLPNRPLGVLRQWLASENLLLIPWVKAQILARYGPTTIAEREVLAEVLEDIYLRAVQLFDLSRGLYFTTYAVKSMQLSGYRNWMERLSLDLRRHQRTQSLDWRSDNADWHGDSPLEMDCSTPCDTVTAPVDLRDMLSCCNRFLSKRERLVVAGLAKGETIPQIARRVGTSKQYAQQLLDKARAKLSPLRERLGV